MCGRYGFLGTAEELSQDFPGLTVVDPAVVGYNLGPGRKLSVVLSEGGKLQLRSLSWGLRTRAIPKPLVNLRAEGISRHALFGQLLAERRCLIPADHFFEWLDDSEPRQPFVAREPGAGLSRRGSDYRVDLAGVHLDGTFAILTTQATGKLADVHGRMPIILRAIATRRWLNPAVRDTQSLREAVAPWPERAIEVYPVALAVNDARVDGEALIAHLPTSRQLRERERNSRH